MRRRRSVAPEPAKPDAATASGVQAIEHHRRKVRVFSTIELVNALEQEKAEGKAGADRSKAMTKLDLGDPWTNWATCRSAPSGGASAAPPGLSKLHETLQRRLARRPRCDFARRLALCGVAFSVAMAASISASFIAATSGPA